MEFRLDLSKVLKDLIGVPCGLSGISAGYSKGFGWDLNQNHPENLG